MANDPLQMHYFGDNFDVLCSYLIVIIVKISIERALIVLFILLFFICMISLVDFRLNTNAKTAKRMEKVAGLYIVAFDITLIVEIIRKFTMVIR